MYNGGFYHMDSQARPFYGYPGNMMQPQNFNQQARGSFYNGAVGGANGANGAQPANGWGSRMTPASGANGVATRTGSFYNGLYTGANAGQPRPGSKVGAPTGHLDRAGSFSLNHGPNNRQPSLGSFGFGSFRTTDSSVSNPDSHLPHLSANNSFHYSYNSFVMNPSHNGAGSAAANTSLLDIGDHTGAGYQNSDAGKLPTGGSFYSYRSFSNGLPGMGPTGSFASSQRGSDVASGNGSEDAEMYNLQRQDSQNVLQRQYSIAGRFYNFNNNNNANPNNTGMTNPAGNPGAFGVMGGVRPGVMLNGRSGGVLPGAGMRPFAPPMMMQQQMQRMQPQQGPPGPQGQRRLGGGGNEGGMKGSNDVVTEGETTLLGRKNSMSNLLDRKDSQKRVGMYFANKEANQADVEYKKDGDPGTTKTASSKARDPSLVNNVKPILLFDTSEDDRRGDNAVVNDVEIDGNTVRAVKPGNDEIQKYDMREVIFVNTREDVEVAGDSLDEIRDTFFNGANVGMMMADADAKAGEPTEWFSWNALKTVMKSVFAKVDSVKASTASSSHYSPTFEVTVSLCVLQDDQMLDLLGDDSNFDCDDYHLENLVVAESPLFGNVPNNAVFVVVENADEFNDTLDACLERARGFFHHEETSAENNKNLDDVEEYGIILATCVLKQTRKSTTSGKFDIVVSSIFASGVGDGIIHYNRILDKNPAEPRALFYSVLHRSCHSTTVFSLRKSNPDIFSSLSTLQRFSKVELRKPKLGSVRQFLYYAETTLPKIKGDIAKMKEGKQKVQTQRFMERLELMSQDMEQMLEDPERCVPKTYI